MIIYKTTNKINGKIYIGQDSKNNSDYLGSGLKLLRAIKKYGKENFLKEILEECNSIEQLDEREIYWIDYYKSVDRNIGYNITAGGNSAGLKLGHEISRKGLYNYWVEQHGQERADILWAEKKKKNSDANKLNGTVFSKGIYKHWVEKYGKEEADKRLEIKKEKLRQINKKRREEGWCHSEETKKIIKAASEGRKISEETRKKMSESAKKINKNHLNKAILQFTLENVFVKEWASITEAAQELKTSNNMIQRVLNGKRSKTKNSIWKYK